MAKKIESAYKKIFTDEVLYIPYEEIKKIEKNIAPTAEIIKKKLSFKQSVNELWSVEGIISMLLKGLNPSSITYTVATVKLLFENTTQTQKQKILELGSGAGWSTCLLWQFFCKNYSNKKVLIFSVDNSPYAIASTKLMLEYFKIPFQICSAKKIDIKIENGVVLILSDFLGAVDLFNNEELNGAYSNHGISYLNEDEYLNLSKKLHKKLKKGASFIIDSLDSKIVLKLNKAKIMINVLLGNNELHPKGKEIIIKEVNGLKVIKFLNRIPERRFMDWLHYLLFHEFKTFLGYMKALSRSENAQQGLRTSVGVVSNENTAKKLEKYGFKNQEVPNSVKNILPIFVKTLWLKK